MIHLTVATPMGIDSLFFSFIRRIASKNNHEFVDPQVAQIDQEQFSRWIEELKESTRHHFIIGYRYPPSCWKELVENATTVILLADGDGIARQVESFQRQVKEGNIPEEINKIVQEMSPSINSILVMTQLLLSTRNGKHLIVPGCAFGKDTGEAFQRIERFYEVSNIPIVNTCWKDFSIEATPLVEQVPPASSAVKLQLEKNFSARSLTASRIKAVRKLFNDG